MVRELRPEEVENEKEYLRGEFNRIANDVLNVITELEGFDSDYRNAPVTFYLHDEIATAEELERMLRGINLYDNTDEEE